MYTDYLVLTALLDEKATVRKLTWLGVNSEKELEKLRKFAIFGYKGYKRGQLFAGDNGERIMFTATGASAVDKALSSAINGLEGRSVARLDLQVTIPVVNADNVVNFIQPNKIYKSMRITSLSDAGVTLYIGSAKSDLRLRVYNKTAESGIKADDGSQLVRFELQLRNSYADSALNAVRGGGSGLHFLTILKRMVDLSTYTFVEKMVEKYEKELFVEPYLTADVEDKDEKTKRWLERSVMPALRRLALNDKEYVDNFLEAVYTAINPDDNGLVRF